MEERVEAMISMHKYNPWYRNTYEAILHMANWSLLEAEIDRKLVCVFSWMPRTIMNVKHVDTADGEPQTKAGVFKREEIESALSAHAANFYELRCMHLLEESFKLTSIENENVVRLFDCLKEFLGSTAASKYLHFSAPFLFPMWDSSIRKENKVTDSNGSAYLGFLEAIRAKLTSNQSALRDAREAYLPNPIRGYDIVMMEASR